MKPTLIKTICSYCCLISMVFSTLLLKAANKDTIKRVTAFNPNKEMSIFQSLLGEEVLTVTIKTTLDSLMINKRTDRGYAGELSYIDAKGTTINQSIQLKPRGRSRRTYCDFPPLKIKFSKEELEAQGLSKSHKSLKLVTHCTNGAGSKQNVLEEYLAYKMYNELTNNSLKVQLIKVKYEDTNSNTSFKRYAILLEDIDELAERMDGKEVAKYGMELTNFDQAEIHTFAMFQYMIGNEDWRLPFLRNVKIVQSNVDGKLMAIPYDFDVSGLVNAAYAKPDQDLILQSVRQRVFMGDFRNKTERAAIVALFNAKKEAIFKVVNNLKVLDKASRIETNAYLNDFYEIINTPKLLRKTMPVNGSAPAISGTDGHFY